MNAVAKELRRELLIGGDGTKMVHGTWTTPEWQDLTTLNPCVLASAMIDFPTNSFDEIHIYDSLQRYGQQGDERFFRAQFSELHRILKPNGLLVGTVPMWDSPVAWMPGHTRVITKQGLATLDFFCPYAAMEEEHAFGFILQAIK